MKQLFWGMVFTLTLGATSLLAENITVAARWDGRPIDYEKSDHDFADVVRALVIPALTETKRSYSPGGARFQLKVADSMKVSGDLSEFYFRISQSAKFTSGAPVSKRDVLYSIQRCQRRGELPQVAEILTEPSISEASISGESELWLGFRVKRTGQNAEMFVNLANALAACPIVQRDISVLFDRVNFQRTMVVGAGEFTVTEFDLSRKQLVLSRIYSNRNKIQGLQNITLKGFASDRDALTALRVGTVDMLIVTDPLIAAMAKEDETMNEVLCGDKSIILRRGYQLDCQGRFALESYHRLQ